MQTSFHFRSLSCSHLRILLESWIKFERSVPSAVFGLNIQPIFTVMLNAVERLSIAFNAPTALRRIPEKMI